MAGRVAAHLMAETGIRSWHIEPQVCPCMDSPREEAVKQDALLAPRCQSYHPLSGRRSCVYWYATYRHHNSLNRVDTGLLFGEMEVDGMLQMRCGVLCLAQRRNAPPGV